jgi:hypothetical protein
MVTELQLTFIFLHEHQAAESIISVSFKAGVLADTNPHRNGHRLQSVVAVITVGALGLIGIGQADQVVVNVIGISFLGAVCGGYLVTRYIGT